MEANRAVQPRLGSALFHSLSRSRVVLADGIDKFRLVYSDQASSEFVWVKWLDSTGLRSLVGR
jgi:hypothetical protein